MIIYYTGSQSKTHTPLHQSIVLNCIFFFNYAYLKFFYYYLLFQIIYLLNKQSQLLLIIVTELAGIRFDQIQEKHSEEYQYQYTAVHDAVFLFVFVKFPNPWTYIPDDLMLWA